MATDPVERRDDVADRAAGRCWSSTFSETRCASGAMPALRAVRVVAVAGDDAGDVRAVAVVVVGSVRPLTKSTNFVDALVAVREQLRDVPCGQVVVPGA